MSRNMKQVLIVNSTLALPPGKMAAQVAHASIGAFLKAGDADQSTWLDLGMPKIVLDGASELQLIELIQQSRDADLPAYIVKDAGKTVVPAGTVTCLGIGPAASEKIDALTRALPLLK